MAEWSCMSTAKNRLKLLQKILCALGSEFIGLTYNADASFHKGIK